MLEHGLYPIDLRNVQIISEVLGEKINKVFPRVNQNNIDFMMDLNSTKEGEYEEIREKLFSLGINCDYGYYYPTFCMKDHEESMRFCVSAWLCFLTATFPHFFRI